MIEPIAGWSSRFEDPLLLLSAPENRGHILYTERMRPLRDIRRIVDDVLTQLPAADLSLLAIEQIVTEEGEYGAIATLGRGAAVERTIGVVFGDDFYALCVGLPATASDGPAFEAQVRKSVARDGHMLGVRRRRYRYAAPHEWSRAQVGLFHEVWVSADQRLAIYPALPISTAMSAAHLLAQLMPTQSTIESTIEQLHTPMRLTGTSVKVRTASDSLHHLVVLQDDRYLYPVYFQSGGTVDSSAFDAVVRSVEPIPRNTVALPSTSAVAWVVD